MRDVIRVGRAGKLSHALIVSLDVTAAVVDVGAFDRRLQDVLLHRGARHAIALDVGHGQLAWRI